MTGTTGTLVKTSLVDYPGKVAAAFFVRGCNMRCPYCYNKSLVVQGDGARFDDESAADVAEVIAHLKKRKKVLAGFVLSGGEPLLSSGTAELVSAARRLGYSVKLDTNGTCPEILERFLENPETRPDYIALDVKTSPERYVLLSPDRDFKEEIARSIRIVSALPSAAREFRTVLVPPLVARDDVQKIARLLPEDASWFFSPFVAGGCVDAAYDAVSPYTDAETALLVDAARKIIPNARLR